MRVLKPLADIAVFPAGMDGDWLVNARQRLYNGIRIVNRVSAMASDIQKLIDDLRSLSPDERLRVRQALDEAPPVAKAAPPTTEEDFIRQLAVIGVVRDCRAPRRDADAFRQRMPVTIGGQPLSQTIIEDRR